MLFLKAITKEGKVEYFNADKILSLQPQGKYLKILMGAGLYWHVEANSIEVIELKYIINQLQ